MSVGRGVHAARPNSDHHLCLLANNEWCSPAVHPVGHIVGTGTHTHTHIRKSNLGSDQKEVTVLFFFRGRVDLSRPPATH